MVAKVSKMSFDEVPAHPDHFFDLPQPLDRFSLSKILDEIAIPTEPKTFTRNCSVLLADFVKIRPHDYKDFTGQQLKDLKFLVGADGSICPKSCDNLEQNDYSSDSTLPDSSLQLPNAVPVLEENVENESVLIKENVGEPDPIKLGEKIKEKPTLPKVLTLSQTNTDPDKAASKKRKREPVVEIIKLPFYDVWDRVEKLMSESERSLKKNRYHYSKISKYLALLGYDLAKQNELSFQSRLNLSKTTRLNVDYLYRKVKKLNRSHTIKKRHRCKQCSFATESLLVLDDHLRKPHLVRDNIMDEDTITLISTYTLRCPYCFYRNRRSHVMRDHIERSHRVPLLYVPTFEPPPRFYSCILCLYEVDKEVNLVHHMEKCKARYDPKCFLSLSRMYTSYFPFTYDTSIPRNSATLCFTEAASLQPIPVYTTTTPSSSNNPLGLNYNWKGPPNTTPFHAFSNIKPVSTFTSGSHDQPLMLRFGAQTSTAQFTTADLFKQSPSSKGGLGKPTEQLDSRNLLHKYMSMLKTLTPSSSSTLTQSAVKESVSVATTPLNLVGEGGNTAFGVNISGPKSKYQVLVKSSTHLTDPQKKGIIDTLMTSFNRNADKTGGSSPPANQTVYVEVTPNTTKTNTPTSSGGSVANSSLESLNTLVSTLRNKTLNKNAVGTTESNDRHNLFKDLLNYEKHRKSAIALAKSYPSRPATLAEIVNRADHGNKTQLKSTSGPAKNHMEHIDLDSSDETSSSDDSFGAGDKRKARPLPKSRAAAKKKRSTSPDSDGEIAILGEYKISTLPKTTTRNRKDGNNLDSRSSSRSVEGKSTNAEVSTGSSREMTCEICDVSYVAILEACAPHKFGDNRDQAIIDHYDTVHNVRICPKNQNKLSFVGHRPNKSGQFNLPMPPLSCRRCLTRYYTLIGLERHLSSSHDVILPDIAGIMARSSNRGGTGAVPKFCIWCSNRDNLILFMGAGGPGAGVDMIAHLSQTHGIDLRMRGSPTYPCTLCVGSEGAQPPSTVAFECYETLVKHAARAHGVTLPTARSDSAGPNLVDGVASSSSQTPTNLANSAVSPLNIESTPTKGDEPSTSRFSFPCTFCQSQSATNNSGSTKHYHPNAGAFMLHVLTEHAALLTPGITKRIMESSGGEPVSKPPLNLEDGANIFLNHIPDTIYTLYNQCALAANTLMATRPTNGPNKGSGDSGFTLGNLFNPDKNGGEERRNCEAGPNFAGQFNEPSGSRDNHSTGNDSSSNPSSQSYHANCLPTLKPIYSSPTKQSHLYCV